MISIRFPDKATERHAFGFLAGRFSFKSWDTGQMIVEDEALVALARERITFLVEGPATYEQRVPSVRIPAAKAV